jgi:hypothetical protein
MIVTFTFEEIKKKVFAVHVWLASQYINNLQRYNFLLHCAPNKSCNRYKEYRTPQIENLQFEEK